MAGKTARVCFAVSVGINLCLTVILFTPFTEQLYKPLIVHETPAKSEVIVVLSAGAYECGLPDFGTLTRLRKGLELYRQGWADKILCAGGDKYTESRKSIAEIMKETLILCGVPAEDVFVQDETVNTYNDITGLLKKYEKRFNFNESIFVTSAYHTLRVKMILQKKKIDGSVISADPYQLVPKKWTERLDLFREIVREYLAICYFKLRGYI